MSWPVRSRRLVAYRGNLVAGVQDLGTVPAGKTWLVKDWVVANITGGSSSYELYDHEGSTYYPVTMEIAMASNQIHGPGRQGDIVLPAGNSLAMYVGNTGTWSVIVFGAQLG